jgi:hypothetical protein
MDKNSLTSLLLSLFPGFAQYWDTEDIHRENDRSFTSHGLMSSFTHYFRSNWQHVSSESLTVFGDEIEKIVAADPNDESEVANAICTCFLENIAGAEAGTALEPYLGKECKVFYDHWI